MSAITHNIVRVKSIGVVSKTALLEDVGPDFSQDSELTVVEGETQNPTQHGASNDKLADEGPNTDRKVEEVTEGLRVECVCLTSRCVSSSSSVGEGSLSWAWEGETKSGGI